MIIQRVHSISTQEGHSSMAEIGSGRGARGGLIGLKRANATMKCFIAASCPERVKSGLAKRGIKTAYELPIGARALGRMCGRDHGVSVVSIPC